MKQVVITGASSGIGAETARQLSPHASLVLVGRNVEKLTAVVNECEDACSIAVDLIEDVQPIVNALMGTADARVLINCAGIAEYGPYHEMEWHTIDRQLQVNLIAPMRLSHALLPWLLAGQGQVINVLSIAATQTFPGAAAYMAGKAGLLAAARAWQAEYRRLGLRISNVLPGATDTPIWDGGGFVPERSDMLPCSAVAEAIASLVLMPADRNVDELTLMPPKGIL